MKVFFLIKDKTDPFRGVGSRKVVCSVEKGRRLPRVRTSGMLIRNPGSTRAG